MNQMMKTAHSACLGKHFEWFTWVWQPFTQCVALLFQWLDANATVIEPSLVHLHLGTTWYPLSLYPKYQHLKWNIWSSSLFDLDPSLIKTYQEVSCLFLIWVQRFFLLDVSSCLMFWVGTCLPFSLLFCWSPIFNYIENYLEFVFGEVELKAVI